MENKARVLCLNLRRLQDSWIGAEFGNTNIHAELACNKFGIDIEQPSLRAKFLGLRLRVKLLANGVSKVRFVMNTIKYAGKQ